MDTNLLAARRSSLSLIFDYINGFHDGEFIATVVSTRV